MPPTILVVEDDPHILLLLREVLSEAGYRVRGAADGLVALRNIASDPPALLLADIRLPGLDGVRLAHEVQARPAPIPVLLMSAQPPPATAAPFPFLAKPFALDDLLARVTQLVAVPDRAPPATIAPLPQPIDTRPRHDRGPQDGSLAWTPPMPSPRSPRPSASVGASST
jgi:DNA-binding response OmpR family regulator